MANTIKIRRVVETEVPLLRKPTDDELLMIKNDEIFDIDEGLFDWDNEETIDEDYLYCEEWLIQLGKDILMVDKPDILNLFCGMNKYGFRIDIKPEVNPDLLCDAHSFADKLDGKRFNLIIADPPYSTEEARDIYGTPPLKYKKWTAECDKVLDEGGLLMVYHKYVMPNPNPEKYIVVKRVFIGNRTMHLPRVCIVFQKKSKQV
jgi:hypothetical protein